MAKTKAKNKKTKSEIKNKPDSLLWGLIAIIPFGWIILWANINHRRSEVEKGLRTKDSAIKSIDNYALGFTIIMVMLCIALDVIVYTYGSQSSMQQVSIIQAIAAVLLIAFSAMGYTAVMGILCIALFAMAFVCGHDITQYMVTINVIAVVILIVSFENNKSRIRDFGLETEGKLNDVPLEDVTNGILSYESYISKVEELKAILESIDIDNPDDKEELLDLRNEINDFFEMCKDAEFDGGGKYKLYELKSEYYFVMGDKVHAKEYIEEAAKIKREEDNRKK